MLNIMVKFWGGSELTIFWKMIDSMQKGHIFFFKQKTAYEISACLVGSEMCIRDS